MGAVTACGGGSGDDDVPDAGIDARPTPDSGGDIDAVVVVGDTDIRDVQNGTVTAGAVVILEDVVVTAVDLGDTTGFFVQEPTGDAAYSGVYVEVTNAALTLPAVGDLVTVSGTVSEFVRSGETGSRTTLGTVTSIVAGGAGTLPAVTLLAQIDLVDDVGEPWEGVLVQVDVPEVQSRNDTGGAVLTEGLVVDDRLFAWTQPYAGDTYDSLTGVMDWDYSTARLYPRSADDIVGYVGSTARVTTVTPPTPTVLQGNSLTLTVTLDRPAPAGGQIVDLLSSAPTLAAVDVAVTVAEGATTATFVVDAIAAGPVVTITASIGTSSATSMVTVASGSGAVVSTIGGAASVVTAGGTGVVLITLSAPAPVGGTAVTLSSSSASVVVPASVTVPEGASTVTFGIIGGAAAGPATITATAPDGGTTATITAVAAAAAPTAGQILINEVLYDPPGAAAGDTAGDANCSGTRTADDQFVELYNSTTAPISLTGVSIWDATALAGAVTPRFTFTAFTLGAGEVVTVHGAAPGTTTASGPWCTGATAGRIGDGAAVGLGSLALDDDADGDTVTVTATALAASAVLDAVIYSGSEAVDQSFTREPDGIGLFVSHGAAVGHATDRSFTPGTQFTGAAWATVRP